MMHFIFQIALSLVLNFYINVIKQDNATDKMVDTGNGTHYTGLERQIPHILHERS